MGAEHGLACDNNKPCGCALLRGEKQPHFCLNYYQCGKDMKFGVCALDDLHMNFDGTLDHFKAKNVNVRAKQIKCCLDLDGGSDHSMAMALLANNTRALDLRAGDAAAEMQSWSASMAGAGAGGVFVAAWSALAFFAYLHFNRGRRSLLNVNTMLG